MQTKVEQQLKHNDCGIAAVKIIYNLHQINISRSYIEEHIFLTENGSSLNDIKTFFDQEKFETSLNLLDLNSLKFDTEKIEAYLPCVLPVKNNQGLHYVVIQSVHRKKLVVLDPAKGSSDKWTFSQLLNNAHNATADFDFVSNKALIEKVISDELSDYEISPAEIVDQDEGDVLNKLTYFSYIKQNFPFANMDAEKKFLIDLLFNQQINLLPKQFKTLKLKESKLRISAPVVLTIRKGKEAILHKAADTIIPTPTNAYRRLIAEMKPYHKLWGIYILSAIFAAFVAQLTIFSNQILIDHILPAYNLNLLLLFAIGLGIFRVFDLILSLYKSFISIHLANIFDNFFLTSFIQKLNTFSIRYIHTFSRGDLTERIKDSLVLKTFFIRFFTRIIIDAFVTAYSLLILFIINWKIALIVLAVLIVFLYLV